MTSTTAYSARDAKELHRQGTAFGAAMAELHSGPAILRRRVHEAFVSLREDKIERDLVDIPVERLREVTHGGLRVGSLSRAGYSTVAAVYATTPSQLQMINGIGSATANQAVAAARQIAEAIRDNLQFRVDMDPEDSRSTALICALHSWDGYASVAERVHNVVEQAEPDLNAALSAGLPACHRIRSLFRTNSARAGAQAGIARVAELVGWAETSGLGQALRRAMEILRSEVRADEAWKAFERQSVEYYGRLSEIVDLGLDLEAAEGYLPADIIKRAKQQRLDDTFRRVALRGYQAFGARFALTQKRVIIGDEMGLGKTIQAIAAIAHLRTLDHKHFLVACPASVVVNWSREVAARSSLRPYRIHGPERAANLQAWTRNGGVGITTLDSLHHVQVDDQINIGMLIIDEAHYVKNPKTRRAQNLKVWTDRVERVLFLTGTPMENRVEEFRNLVEYLQPNVADTVDGHHGVAGPNVFRKAVAPVYLRRNQEDVLLELPELRKIDEWVEFTGADEDIYRSAVLDGNFMAMRRAGYMVADATKSAKLTRLIEIVAECAENGRKVVIFSYFRDVLEIVHSLLPGQSSGPLTGSTSATKRQAMIDSFGAVDGHAVLLSQIQAGGVGLNMQVANIVILCEPQIKPTIEQQAIARLHRMGQVRAVQVHRLLASNSCDDRLLELLAQKTQLFDEYARRSDIANASPEAVDNSDAAIAKTIIEAEQERFLSTFSNEQLK